MKGFTGKVLQVDLSTVGITPEEISDQVYESLPSGVGLGRTICTGTSPNNVDPLGPAVAVLPLP